MEFFTIDDPKGREGVLPLLLEADPDENMLRRYLHEGHMTAAVEGEKVLGVALVVRLPNGSWELKNLAVQACHRRCGIGKALINAALSPLPQGARVWVGTSKSGVGYYESGGFTYSHTVHSFFLTHYGEPIFENGERVRDMYYLSRDL